MKKDNYKLLNHKERPSAIDYINLIFSDFLELKGDRLFADDRATICGIATIENIPVTIITQVRGKNIKDNLECNFSMMRPEGFRKAIRLMKQAEKFHRPVICFIDTIGAYPGIAAEEHNQSSAISMCIMEMLTLKTPIISVLIGYGGSGGAIALCAADRIVALEHATLSVISPKAYAEIIWKDTTKVEDAIKQLNMSSTQLLKDKIIDRIIPEPNEGAHSDPKETAFRIKEYLLKELKKLQIQSSSRLIKKRRLKFDDLNKRRCF